MSSFSARTIILDVQHMGKPHRPNDRGAKCMEFLESDLCLQYARIAYTLLSSVGFKVYLLTHGTYSQRASFTNWVSADLYLACHLNSSKTPPEKNHAVIEYTELAGEETRKIAKHMCFILQTVLPISHARVQEIPKGGRGWACIASVRAPALLLEPLFINHRRSWTFLRDDISSIGVCISDTIIGFFSSGIGILINEKPIRKEINSETIL